MRTNLVTSLTRCLSSWLAVLTTALPAFAQNSKRLGLSHEDQKRFDENMAAGDFYFYLSIVLIVTGFLALIVGLVYHWRKQSAAKRSSS